MPAPVPAAIAEVIIFTATGKFIYATAATIAAAAIAIVTLLPIREIPYFSVRRYVFFPKVEITFLV